MESYPFHNSAQNQLHYESRNSTSGCLVSNLPIRIQAGPISLQAYDFGNTGATPMVIVHDIQDFALAFSEIAEAGHMIHLDAPEKFIEIMKEWL